MATQFNPNDPYPAGMLHIPRWDFHWQRSYRFAQPKELKPGDRMSSLTRIHLPFTYASTAGAMRHPVADEIAAAFRNDGQPVFRIFLEHRPLERIELVTDENGDGHADQPAHTLAKT